MEYLSTAHLDKYGNVVLKLEALITIFQNLYRSHDLSFFFFSFPSRLSFRLVVVKLLIF